MNKDWKCTADLPERNRRRLAQYLRALMGLFLLGGRRTFPYAAIGTLNKKNVSA